VADRQRIKGIIVEAATHSNIMSDNANYIKSKMGAGDWSVSISDPGSSDFGFYACIIRDYWGLLWEFGPNGWAYIILRYR
jgi:hypothetical protein